MPRRPTKPRPWPQPMAASRSASSPGSRGSASTAPRLSSRTAPRGVGVVWRKQLERRRCDRAGVHGGMSAQCVRFRSKQCARLSKGESHRRRHDAWAGRIPIFSHRKTLPSALGGKLLSNDWPLAPPRDAQHTALPRQGGDAHIGPGRGIAHCLDVQARAQRGRGQRPEGMQGWRSSASRDGADCPRRTQSARPGQSGPLAKKKRTDDWKVDLSGRRRTCGRRRPRNLAVHGMRWSQATGLAAGHAPQAAMPRRRHSPRFGPHRPWGGCRRICSRRTQFGSSQAMRPPQAHRIVAGQRVMGPPSAAGSPRAALWRNLMGQSCEPTF